MSIIILADTFFFHFVKKNKIHALNIEYPKKKKRKNNLGNTSKFSIELSDELL